jgi:hypothetical protein
VSKAWGWFVKDVTLNPFLKSEVPQIRGAAVRRQCVCGCAIGPLVPFTARTLRRNPSQKGMTLLTVLALTFLCVTPIALVSAATNGSPGLAIAWNDHSNSNRTGWVQAMDANAPWSVLPGRIEVGSDALLRYAQGKLYVLRPSADMVSVIDPTTWQTTRSYTLRRGTEPEDIAVTAADTAYVTGRRATRLIRLTLSSGATEEVADLSLFADADGIPDLGGMFTEDDCWCRCAG